MGFLRFARLE